MIAPALTSATFDKSSYNPGDLMTVTVAYLPGKSDAVQQFTGTGTDSATGQSGELQVSFTVANATTDPTSVTGADNAGRKYNKISDNGSLAVFTATA